MKLMIFLLIGIAQTLGGHLLGLHDGLPHMQYTHNWEYVVEVVFYAVLWYCLWRWLKKKDTETNNNRYVR